MPPANDDTTPTGPAPQDPGRTPEPPVPPVEPKPELPEQPVPPVTPAPEPPTPGPKADDDDSAMPNDAMPDQEQQPAGQPGPEQPAAPSAPGTPDGDGYYGDREAGDDELDLSFLDEEKQQDPVQDAPKAP